MFKYKETTSIEEKDLPRNRKEQLKEIIKYDSFLISKLSLVNVLFNSPFIIVSTLIYLFISTNDLTNSELFSIVFYMSVLYIPAFMISRIFKGGTYNVIKKRTFNEGYMFSKALFESVKENFVQNMFNGLILGLIVFASIVGALYLYILSDGFIFTLGISALLIMLIIAINTSEIMLISNNIYKISFFDNMKNGVSFSLMQIFITALYGIIEIVVPLILVYFSAYSILILEILLLVYLSGLIETIYSLIYISLFDLYINKENYKEHYLKGLKKGDKNV